MKREREKTIEEKVWRVWTRKIKIGKKKKETKILNISR